MVASCICYNGLKGKFMKTNSQGFGLILLIVAVAIVAILATWQLTGHKSPSQPTTAGLLDIEKQAKQDLKNINEKLEQQLPTQPNQ